MATERSESAAFDLGVVDQVSYAVHSVQQALPEFERVFGSFTVATVELSDLLYRGRKSEAVLNLAFGQSGDLEIELVEPVSGDFPQVEFLARHGEGLHHVRYMVSDLEEKMAPMVAAGYQVAVQGASGNSRFAYLEAPGSFGDSMIELLQRDDS